MEIKTKGMLKNVKDFAKKNMEAVDMEAVKNKAADLGGALADKAEDLKDLAHEAKEDIADKITELDRMLTAAINEYNSAYTLMNDKGVRLFVERKRALDSIAFVEELVNGLANRPKAFDADFEEIKAARSQFVNSCEFADRELQAARQAAGGAGAGLAAGASVAFMAPTAAMWVATTFGTASTGTAISALSGAAASNAALAWLGGGALIKGGGGMVAGKALLAMAGPVGWSIAGATLLSSIVILSTKKMKLNKQKNEEIEKVKKNIEAVTEMDAQISEILRETETVREKLNRSYLDSVSMRGADYSVLEDEQKKLLGALVNNTKALTALLGKTLEA